MTEVIPLATSHQQNANTRQLVTKSSRWMEITVRPLPRSLGGGWAHAEKVRSSNDNRTLSYGPHNGDGVGRVPFGQRRTGLVRPLMVRSSSPSAPFPEIG